MESNNENKINNEDKIMIKERDVKDEKKSIQKEIKEEIKNDKKEEKIEINDKILNNYFKPFPVKLDVDFKLKKKYKSTQKYDNINMISGTILPESNLILSGNSDGQLNIYYYYSGEISKHYSFFHEIKNLNYVDKKTFIYSSDYSINIFDVEIGKNILSFYAHDTTIYSLYYDENYKNIISSTKEGIICGWDFHHKSSIPFISHFLFDENNIISTDYNRENKFFYSLGKNSNINILNMFEEEKIYKFKLEDNHNKPISISANLNNLNQFIVGYEKGFKIFDIRNFGCVDDWTKNLDVKIEKCIIDSNNILIQNEIGIMLYDNKEKKKIDEKVLKDKIGFFNFINFPKEESKIIYGDGNGNVFYSMN